MITNEQVRSLTDKMNEQGIPVDTLLIDAMIHRLDDISPLNTRQCNSVTAMQGLARKVGYDLPNLTEPEVTKAVSVLESCPVLSLEQKYFLQELKARQVTAMISLKKLYKMRDLQVDGRLHECFEANATKTGRWTSKGIQLQNFPKSTNAEESYVELANGTATALDLKNLLRYTIKAPEGKTLIIADYKQIEARVAAWIVGDYEKLKCYREGMDIYQEVSDKLGLGDRTLGKLAELSLAYGGGRVVLVAQSKNYNINLSFDKAETIVTAWRNANPNITDMWCMLEDAAKSKVWASCGTTGLEVQFNAIKLPSGRVMSIDISNENGATIFNYVCQGLARDILAEKMYETIDYYPIVMCVHDEIVCEVEADNTQAEEAIKGRLETPMPWAEDLPLAIDIISSERYVKP